MKKAHFIISLILIGMLVWFKQTFVPADQAIYGGLNWLAWVSLGVVGCGIAFLVIVLDSAKGSGFSRIVRRRPVSPIVVRELDREELAELGLDKYRGPKYPHPVIFPQRCIGCQACVDACPHNVLAIIDGIASAVAPDLCMEDTACQAECPVNPKACIVINTTKQVRSLPMPTRDGSTFQTNVPGCFIIGDVSGVPLIKNAVKEGADVIRYIASELKEAPPEVRAKYDVAIIGIGPGGASAAASAIDAGLRYVAIEQGKMLSTVEQYPKGKYIFFKPDTKGWSGGIPMLGLGLKKSDKSYDSASDESSIHGLIEDNLIEEETYRLHDELIAKLPSPVRNDLSQALAERIRTGIQYRIASYLRTKGDGDWLRLYQSDFLPNRENLMSGIRSDVAVQLQTSVAGDQRENILDLWRSSLNEKGVNINEFESCKSISRAEDGDYFTIQTERGTEKLPGSYTARRVVIAIGLRGSPNKLRLPNEDLTVIIRGREGKKVHYELPNPDDFCGYNIAVVGGGNVAVEAAVDLVSVRDGAGIRPRPPEKMNRVTLLVRDYLAPTVKFGNKFLLYKCADEGLIDLRFDVAIKKMSPDQLLLEEVSTGTEIGAIPNDYVFALIGGERPNRFLESIGITIK